MPTAATRAEQRVGQEHREAHDPGVFRDWQTRAAMLAMYDAGLAAWPVPFEELDVASRYGRTHVVAAGPLNATPLILVHMANCPSFLWAPIIAPLAQRYRTYAIDTIGDIGKSELDDLSVYPKRGEDYSAWLCDVCDALGFEQALVVAASMGGWIAINHAACAPERVLKQALLVPMGLPSRIQALRMLAHMMANAV